MPKAVCFPHSDDQFETPSELMEWLNYSLKDTHRGYYRYRKAPGLGRLEPGSVVFFYKNKLIVGSAVVEKEPRPLRPEEVERCDEIHGTQNNCAGMKNVVKFFIKSIWVWSEHELVSEAEFKQITGKNLQNYVSIESTDILKLYEIVAMKRTEMDSRS